MSNTGHETIHLPPYEILLALNNVKNVHGTTNKKINQKALYSALSAILSSESIEKLKWYDDKITNQLIINIILELCVSLNYPYGENLIRRIEILCNDNDKKKIAGLLLKLKYRSYLSRYKSIGIILAIAFLMLLASKIICGNSKSPLKYPSVNTPENGDLTNEFSSNKGSNDPERTPQKIVHEPNDLTAEEKYQIQKEKMTSEGWRESNEKNGNMSPCYNFKEKKSNIENYLEVQVGGGTDVAIKLMNIVTGNCIRYVFINSGTTYRITNIPEGSYYVKIAYGKDWHSKNENGQCIGKFLLNPIYEKGDDVMDYNLKYTTEGYSIPSFKLKLDVIASSPLNTFNSQAMSEEDFNK
jgi:hypothetical protein